ncbi:hypothetical protein [Portibacter marinus]|uniref:hypothetical protein n=1 Tax=Portibacter marinus TaxID=2898660 RepID=UPI001F203432|nr:hypothetical protein [Portibacter marinus]
MMKNINILMTLAILVLLGTSSCEDPERLPLVVLDTVEKGAYPRLIDDTNTLINLFDVDGSAYTYEVEFVDEQGGGLVEEYILDIVYDDNNPSNGDNSAGPVEFLKFDASQFTESENGYLKAPEITITGPEALGAFGLSEDEVLAGDNFHFQGRIILEDGRVFSQNNSSATVTGPAFRGHFNFTMPANCPSDLTGTYSYVTSDIWCPESDGPVSGTVDIVAQGGGVYKFSDWAFGSYVPCYGGGGAGGNLTFAETCAEVEFTGFTDSFGDTWTFESSIDGEEWTIKWENTFGEFATSVITFPGGVPFVLAE